MEGVVRVNIVNFLTIGLIALVWIAAVKYAMKTWMPTSTITQYI